MIWRAVLVIFLLLCWRGLIVAEPLSPGRWIADTPLHWRFQTGDDRRWAEPSFDDSRWRIIEGRGSWTEQGGPQQASYAWYRQTVELSREQAASGALGLAVRYIADAYEVYGNGRLIGAAGRMPPQGTWQPPRAMAFALPSKLIGDDHRLTLALRIWRTPGFPSFSPYAGLVGGPPQIGTWPAVQALLQERATIHGMRVASCLIVLLVSAYVLRFYLAERERKEYLWFAVFGFADAVLIPYFLWTGLFGWPLLVCRGVAGAISTGALLAFTWSFCGVRPPIAVWIASAGGWFVIVATYLAFPQQRAWIDIAGDSLLILPSFAAVLGMMARRWGVQREARLLAIGFAPLFLVEMVGVLNGALVESGVLGKQGLVPEMYWGPFQIALWPLANVFFFLTMGLILSNRSVRANQQRQRLRQEFEAARQVQELLVPLRPPETPGFAVESAYRPAQEVGGDFFLIVPGEVGALLVVVGDVSGKGLKAAMLVSGIVTALRAITASVSQPIRVLEMLNAALVGQMDGGYATCCCVRIEANGRVKIANAGHLAPYCDGSEVMVAPGLPLGIAADAEWEETETVLRDGGNLVLVSDGVVEARRPDGELLGFERMSGLTRGSAEQIVRAAQAFGQEDDITVVQIRRIAGVMSAPPMAVAGVM